MLMNKAKDRPIDLALEEREREKERGKIILISCFMFILRSLIKIQNGLVLASRLNRPRLHASCLYKLHTFKRRMDGLYVLSVCTQLFILQILERRRQIDNVKRFSAAASLLKNLREIQARSPKASRVISLWEFALKSQMKSLFDGLPFLVMIILF